MDHRKAVQSKATERYLLGEMTELERHMFEEHYFGCEECAEDVRTATAFVDNARSVLAEESPLRREDGADRVWREPGGNWLADWLRPSSLIPMAAAVSLAFITSYQALVTLPGLRQMAAPAVAAPIVLAQATRGETPTVTVDGSGRPVALSLYASEQAAQVSFEVRGADGVSVYSGKGAGPGAGAPLVLFIPAASFPKSGEYQVILRGNQGTDLGEYRFSVDRK